jgi:heme oxygenase
MDYKDRSKQQLVEEKLSLQSTIVSLTDEIESLSVKNEEFLTNRNQKDFYHEYQKVKEELQTLKNAHAILINMIKDEDLQLQTKVNTKESKLGESYDLIKDTSLILGTDLSRMNNDKNNIHYNYAALQEIDLNKGRNNSLSSIFS